MKTNLLRTTLAILCFAGFAANTASAAVIMEYVTVASGIFANTNDSRTGYEYGAVPYSYQIGKYDVTNEQYGEFLNAVDPTGGNAFELYHANMLIGFNLGAAAGSRYSVSASAARKPVQWVSIFDATRFANWLNNGQGSGDTETGAYTLSLGGAAGRNEGATVFLPSEDEWYKAAYYNPTTSAYYQYGTGSNAMPSASAPTASPNSANYNNAAPGVTDVGAYTGSASYYGAFDMAGNVFQWTDDNFGSNYRVARGGWYHYNSADGMSSSFRFPISPLGYEYLSVGFRVASVVPEPTSAVSLILGLGVLAARRYRKRTVR